MSLTIRPLNSGYIPTKPLEYWYHFSCKKYVEKLGITNESDQLPDFTFLIEGGDQLILVDTGMSWTEHADKYHHGPSRQMLILYCLHIFTGIIFSIWKNLQKHVLSAMK